MYVIPRAVLWLSEVCVIPRTVLWLFEVCVTPRTVLWLSEVTYVISRMSKHTNAVSHIKMAPTFSVQKKHSGWSGKCNMHHWSLLEWFLMCWKGQNRRLNCLQGRSLLNLYLCLSSLDDVTKVTAVFAVYILATVNTSTKTSMDKPSLLHYYQKYICYYELRSKPMDIF